MFEVALLGGRGGFQGAHGLYRERGFGDGTIREAWGDLAHADVSQGALERSHRRGGENAQDQRGQGEGR